LGPAVKKNHETRPKIQKDRKNHHGSTGMRHLGAGDKWTTKNVDSSGNDPSDYGKKSFKNYPNERNVTGERTVTSNLKQDVQKPTKGLEDNVKETKKELYTTYSRKGNARMRGSGEHTIPLTQQLRTTIKETSIHDVRTGNVDSNKKSVVYDKKVWKPRVTLRQTNNNKYGSIDPKPTITGPKKGKAYDESSTAKTTIRETTENNDHKGNMSGKSGMSKHKVYDPKDTAKTTTKETTIDSKYTGQANQEVMQRGMGYITANKSATAHNTNRQFTSDKEYFGIGESEQQDGYKISSASAHDTNRQYTSDIEYTGSANSYNKARMSYEDKYNAKLNALKEKIAKGRAPTLSNVKLMSGGDNVVVEPRKKVSIEEKMHQPGLTKIYEGSASEVVQNCQTTKIPNKDDTDNISYRVDDPNLLNAYKANPYTQPLNST